jgi:GntR family transcriptional regulator/MocR family aminotransferase
MDLQLTLDRSRRVPLSIQVAHGLRDAIFVQRLAPGSKLPPSRELAQRLQVSRMVVIEAYEWLIAEGYAEARQGSGTYVLKSLVFPQQSIKRVKDPPRRTDVLFGDPKLIDFRPGLPALDLFPRTAWKGALSRALLHAKTDQLGYGPAEGLPQLRRVIAQYVGRTRGLPVAPEQVVITIGTAQALDLMLRTLSPLDSIALEDPGPEPVQRCIRIHQIKSKPIPMDEQGMRVDLLKTGPHAPQVVHVIPSHQFPTGEAMRLERRIELLNWAEQNDAIVIEDDYDSEFRFDQSPPIALAALNPGGRRVVYIGSFSKTLFPGLRLGFCVVPEKYINRFLELKWFSDRCTPVLEQLALAEWLESGIFERHVRKMRDVYAQRREVLLQALADQFGNRMHVHGVAAGMHVLVDFYLKCSESELVEKALTAGVKIYPAGPCFIGPRPEFPSVIMGFGNLAAPAIGQGVEILGKAFKKFFC